VTQLLDLLHSGPKRKRRQRSDFQPTGIEVFLVAGKLPETVDQALGKLEGAGIYQRGGQLVRVIRSAPVTVRGVWRDDRALSIVTVSAAHLVDTLTRLAPFLKYDARSEQWRPVNCPGEVASVLLSRVGQWPEALIPPLVGILETPTLRPDGSLLATNGFDPGTGLSSTWARRSSRPCPRSRLASRRNGPSIFSASSSRASRSSRRRTAWPPSRRS
jgi:hypothetical protein